MSSNPIDTAIDFVTKKLEQSNFSSHLTPLTIITTLLVLIAPFIFLLALALTQKDEPLPPPQGCRKLGLNGPSNLSDQYSKKYSQGSPPSPSNPWKIKALFIYPVKSCKGIELDKSDIITTGLKYDRQFTLGQHVTSMPTMQGKVKSEWQILTQRSHPRLAKVETELWVPDPAAPGYSPEGEWAKSEGCLAIRFPFTPDVELSVEGMKAYGKILAAKLRGNSEPMVEFRIPFNPTKERIKKKGYKHEKINIWKDAPIALNMGVEVSEEMMAKLKYTLGVANPLSLFRIDTERYRELYKCAPKKKEVGFQPIIGFPDSYPIHIMNLASVHDISSHLPKRNRPLNALRYRANIYITGPPIFDEDNWTKARINNLDYHISCHTTRCKLPNVDPETGEADVNEPGTTMRKYRVIDKGSSSACLGMQVTPLGDGKVRVGDQVRVLERGEHLFLKE